MNTYYIITYPVKQFNIQLNCRIIIDLFTALIYVPTVSTMYILNIKTKTTFGFESEKTKNLAVWSNKNTNSEIDILLL